MQPLQNEQPRINLPELKAQIVKKLGAERSKRYFYYLNRLLTQKLSKSEFDKLCVRTVGRENLPLHNHLIRSILKNACHSKVPPPINNDKEALPKSTIPLGKKSPLTEDGYQQSGSSPSVPTSLICFNGDVLPMSPRKSRSGIRDRRFRDRPSPLGPNGKTDFISHTSTALDSNSVKAITENGNLNSCGFRRPVQHRHGVAEQPGNEQDTLFQRPTKRLRTKKSPDEPAAIHSKGHGGTVIMEEGDDVQQGGISEPARNPFCAPLEIPLCPVIIEDREEVQQGGKSNPARSPLRAPLGIPFCPASVGGTCRPLPSANNSSFVLSSETGELFDSETLRKRMEQIVGAQGLEGVSLDCANLLNNGLDVYLKRLIRSCIELVVSRSGHEPKRQPVPNQPSHGKLINGIWPGHQLQVQNSGGPMEGMPEQRIRYPISLLDFKVAMELNPQQLGEDWPVLLEKICFHSWEE